MAGRELCCVLLSVKLKEENLKKRKSPNYSSVWALKKPVQSFVKLKRNFHTLPDGS